MSYTIIPKKNPSPKNINILSQGLAQNACQIKNQEPIESFSFFIYKNIFKIKIKIKGGCHGCLYYGCLYIDQLWIDESLRHQGFGTRLVQAAENLARQRGCLFATVNTMDWEALDFYKKLGYSVEFERHGYLKNSVFYFLRKEL